MTSKRFAERMATPPSRYIPHQPTDHQKAFLILEDLEALYGGAAGGGKSDALLMAALEHVHVPGYAALLFRRTYKDLALPEALMDRADQWLRGGDAQWNGLEKRWEFPAGATLSFGYLEHEADKFRYQGAAFQFIGFDELTQFTESQYRYLFSRLRRLKGSEVPLRMRAASNPGGEGHEWVRARFIDGGRAEGRVFIPAKLDDNPHVDRAEYERSLAQLDPVTREQLRNGNWDVRAQGPMFDRAWFKIIDEAPSGCRWVRYWDLAATEAKPGKDPDFTAGAKLGMKDGFYFLADMRRTRARPGDVEELVAQTAAADGNGVSIWIEQEPGSSGVNTIDHYQRRVLRGRYMQGHKKTGSKISYARPVSSAAQAGNFFIVRGAWNAEFLDEIHAFPTPGAHDDQVDATSGAFEKVNSGGWVV